MSNERAEEQRSQSNDNEDKTHAFHAFRHEIKFLRENEDQLHSQPMLSKLQRGECNDFWNEIKALNPKKESSP